MEMRLKHITQEAMLAVYLQDQNIAFSQMLMKILS